MMPLRWRFKAPELLKASFLQRAPRWWPLAALAVIAAGVAAGVLLTRRQPGKLDGMSTIYPVQRGNLVSTVSCTGEVYAPRQADLSFDVTKIPVTEIAVKPGQKVKAGDVLARIDTTTLERAVAQAEADLITAQDALEKAKNPYTELDKVKARLAVDQAEAALLEAQQALKTVQNPDIDAAQRAVQSAAAALQNAQTQLVAAESDTGNAAKIRTLEYEANWYHNNYDQAVVKYQNGKIDKFKLDLEYSNMLAADEKLRVAKAQAESTLKAAQSQLADAEAAYKEAQEELAKLQKGGDALANAKAKNDVAQAQYNLDKAKADLLEIEAGAKAKDVEVAQARVTSAQAALETAQATLKAATMTAPFDGTIISVGAEVGDLVSAGTVVIKLADLSNLRVRATIDESDISNLEIDQEVVITFDAFPGRTFRGKVLEVPLEGTLTSNVVTYLVPVSLEKTEGVALKSGMTANLTITVGRLQNVLLIPAMAVEQGDSGNVVKVQEADGTVSETPVETGLSDGTYVHVKAGLNEGDKVVVQYDSSSSTDTDRVRFGGQRMQAMPIGGQQIQAMPAGGPGPMGR